MGHFGVLIGVLRIPPCVLSPGAVTGYHDAFGFVSKSFSGEQSISFVGTAQPTQYQTVCVTRIFVQVRTQSVFDPCGSNASCSFMPCWLVL